MLLRNLQRLINSPLPLLIFGGGSLGFYLFLWTFAQELLGNELVSLLDRFLNSYWIIQILGYWLFFFFTLALLWAVRQSQKGLIGPIFWFLAIFFFLSFSFILMAIPPLTSQDAFWNLFQGRIFSHYHQNPYLVAPQNFSGNPFLKPIQTWRHCPMVYGPIWTLLVSLISFLFPDNLFLQLLLLRIILLIILGGLIAVGVLAVRQFNFSWSFPTFIALAWQPFLLIHTVNNAHNDILIGFTLLLGLFLISRRDYFKGFISLWFGVLIKYTPLLLFPLGIKFLFSQENLKRAIRILIPIIGAIILLTLIAYFPFGYNIFQFKKFSHQSQLFAYTNLPPIPFWLITIGGTISRININKEIILRKGQIPWSFENSSLSLINVVRILSLAIFLVLYLWLVFKPFGNEKDFFKRGFWIFAIYLLIASFWFMDWYLIWLMPLAVVSGLGPTLLSLGWSPLAFPHPYPRLQIFGPLFTLLGLTIFFFIKSVRRIKINSPIP